MTLVSVSSSVSPQGWCKIVYLVILPTSDSSALILLVFSMLCLGSWANAQKLSGKWRFELFYYDYSFGVMVCAVLAAFTLGSLDSQELTFQDNFLIASRHSMAYAAGAGAVFNLGNMLLLGAMQVSGMMVAFLIAFGWRWLGAPLRAISTPRRITRKSTLPCYFRAWSWRWR